MKLILVPLVILIMVSILSITGLGESSLGTLSLRNTGVTPDSILYTATAHPTVYANGTAIGESGTITDVPEISGVAHWANSTGVYVLYTDEACTIVASTVDTVAPLGGGSWTWSGSLGSSLGLMVLIGGLMLFVAVIGARFLTYGQSEFGVSTIFKFTAFIAIWGVFSVLAMPLITAIPVFGNFFFFILTVFYTIGLIFNSGSSSGQESD